MEFRDLLLSDHGFANVDGGFKVTLRVPRFHSMPLSCVRPESIVVDGEIFDGQALMFTVDGHVYRTAELATVSDRSWFVLDDAELRAPRPIPLASGEHDVEVTIALRIPYTFVQAGRRAVEEQLTTKRRLTLEDAAA
jgi:hypothetical protein